MNTLQELMARAEEIRAKYEEYSALDGREAWRTRDYAMGLTGDIGDLIKLIMAKENLLDKPEADEKLGPEFADCLYALLVLANNYNVDLTKEIERKLDMITEKVEKKHV
jgi:NTP pyrophosphatase (non-canonical NTP hydrolase)